MKKIFNIIPFMAVAVALVSCNSVMDDKDDIDAKYVVGTAPTVAVKSATGASTSVIVVGSLSDAKEAVEAGVLISASADMEDATYWAADVVAEEFAAVAKKLEPLSTYYVQAYVVMKDNQTILSDVQQVQTGEPEFGIAQLTGTYAGATTAYWGDDYTYSVSIVIDEEDSTKCKVNDLDPYFAVNGLTAANGYNSYDGVIDWENKLITVEGGQMTGYQTVFIIGMDNADPDVAEDYDDIYIDVKNYGETLVIRNAYGVSSDDGWWELYAGGITLTKQ